MKLIDARKDQFRKLAKHNGYRSRSAYKLIQLNNSYHILRSNMNVVDLGCAPGGWLQVAVEEVGNHGNVLGIDIREVEPLEGVAILHRSIEHPKIVEEIMNIMPSEVDLVLSDLAPDSTGIWDLDHSRQVSLTRTAFNITQRIIKKEGNAVFKVFEGQLLKGLKLEISNYFTKVVFNKPIASRRESSELYLVCLNYRG